MSKPGQILAARIRSELPELALIVERARQGWDKAKTLQDDFYIDGVALNLHSFLFGAGKDF